MSSGLVRVAVRSVIRARIAGAVGLVELVDDAAVGEERGSVRVGRGGGVVGHHDDRLAEVAGGVLEELQQRRAGAGVEVAGGLVGEDDLRPGRQGPRHGDPLLLAAGQLRRPVAQPVGQSEGGDELVDPCRVGTPAGERQREGDVLRRGQGAGRG